MSHRWPWAYLLAVALLLPGVACRRGGSKVPSDTATTSDATTSDATASAATTSAATDDEIEGLCAHSHALILGEGGSAAVRDDFMVGCRRNAEARRAASDPSGWATRRSCILAATDQPALAACDGHVPRAASEPEPRDDETLIAEVCEQMLVLMTQDPDMASVLNEEMKASMADVCMQSARESLAEDPDKFRQAATCVLQAQTIADIEACPD